MWSHTGRGEKRPVKGSFFIIFSTEIPLAVFLSTSLRSYFRIAPLPVWSTCNDAMLDVGALMGATASPITPLWKDVVVNDCSHSFQIPNLNVHLSHIQKGEPLTPFEPVWVGFGGPLRGTKHGSWRHYSMENLIKTSNKTLCICLPNTLSSFYWLAFAPAINGGTAAFRVKGCSCQYRSQCHCIYLFVWPTKT